MKLRKHFSLIFFPFAALAAAAQTSFPPSPQREVRAVWLATIGGLDWPGSYARSAAGIERQQQELRAQLDSLRGMGFNTVLFQTRIRGTVVYPSAFEPWDGCLSGVPGLSPGYDALAFAVGECHKRGMAIQAWVVAFPLMSDKTARQLGKRALPFRRPELCRRAGKNWMMDPGAEGTDDYLAALCAEIADKYDIDGIHLDYIRYPEHSIPFNDNATYRRLGNGAERGEWKRSNVTRCVKKIHAAVKKLKPWVALSCSPIGKHDDLPGFSSLGWNARAAAAQDAQAWLEQGIMDEIFPMMYFKENQFFPFALDWIEGCGGRIAAPGLGVYLLSPEEKEWELQTITRQLGFLRMTGAGGQACFRARHLLEDRKGIAGYLRDFFYRTPALPPALSWEDSVAPGKPDGISVERRSLAWRVSWNGACDPTPGSGVRYNIYRSADYPVDIDSAVLLASLLPRPECTLDMSSPFDRSCFYAVSAIDRFGNESEPAAINVPENAPDVQAELPVSPEGAVRLPALDAQFITIADGAGREVSTARYDTVLHVKPFSPGFYKVYARGKRGGLHRIGSFLVKHAPCESRIKADRNLAGTNR